MAEIVSRQAAKVAAGKKMSPNEAYGKKRVIVITSPETVAWAENDTIASPVILPVGTRFTCNNFASHAAMGTSVTLNVGIREVDGTVIDADGIASAVSVASAGRTAINNGALVAAGVEYVTTKPCQVYATLAGAAASANAQIRIEVEAVTPD